MNEESEERAASREGLKLHYIGRQHRGRGMKLEEVGVSTIRVEPV